MVFLLFGIVKQMNTVSLYTQWHYQYGLKGIVHITANLLWFTFHFFSTGFLLKTLFTPFLRLGEEHVKGAGVEAWFGDLIVNSIMRVVGAVTRFVFVVASLLLSIVVAVIGVVVFVIWALLPVIVLFCAISGAWFVMV